MYYGMQIMANLVISGKGNEQMWEIEVKRGCGILLNHLIPKQVRGGGLQKIPD
jgi:hypothetical protein